MTTIKWLFWNKTEARLRFMWRLIIFALLFAPLVALLQMAIYYLKPGWIDALQGTQAAQFLMAAAASEWLLLIGLFITLLIVGKWVDRRPWADYGFHFGQRWWLDFAFGLALGAVLMTGIFLTEYLLGWVQIVDVFHSFAGMPFASGILWAAALFIATGIFEEMLSRGYLLHNLAETLNYRFWGPGMALLLAWLISSGLFGLAHAGNPNASVISTLNIIVAGLFLGLGYILTGDLAISIGIHMTWNFFQGNVFGFPVSGTPTNGVSFIAVQQKGAVVWTGGAFGPEAGIIGLIAIFVGALLVLGWVKWRYGGIRCQCTIPEPPQNKAPESIALPDA